MGEIVWFVICEDCEPGILPVEHPSAQERAAWIEQHVAETGHRPRVLDYPAGSGD
jgi:hypothetical protein